MSMRRMGSHRGSLAMILVVCLLATTWQVPECLGDQGMLDVRVENVDWKLQGNLVVIMYDLLGPKDMTYEVALELLKKTDTGFRVEPQRVIGQVGQGKFAGVNRSVYWEYKEEMPDGFDFDRAEHYFRVMVAPVETRLGWWKPAVKWVLAGAATAGVVALASTLASKDDGTPATPELPLPPGRP